MWKKKKLNKGPALKGQGTTLKYITSTLITRTVLPMTLKVKKNIEINKEAGKLS